VEEIKMVEKKENQEEEVKKCPILDYNDSNWRDRLKNCLYCVCNKDCDVYRRYPAKDDYEDYHDYLLNKGIK
jgi:hypothetical protein